MISTLK